MEVVLAPSSTTLQLGLAADQSARSGASLSTKKDARKHSYDVVDFIFPQADKHDTSPGHTIDVELRAAQVEMRLAEIDEAHHVLLEICSGNGKKIGEHNMRFKGAIGASSQGLAGIDWDYGREGSMCQTSPW